MTKGQRRMAPAATTYHIPSSIALGASLVENAPTISGSEQQIAWAEKLRVEHTARWANAIVIHLQGKRDSDAWAAEKLATYEAALIEAARSLVATKTDARWWIDQRLVGYPFGTVEDELVRLHKSHKGVR